MLLSDFLTVAFIPSLIAPQAIATPGTEIADFNNGGDLSDSDSYFSPADDVFANDDFFKNSVSASSPPRDKADSKIITDPVLREIYEEEKRLDLAGGDDNDMSSEEARELIKFQRRKWDNENQNQRNRESRGPRGRFLFSSEGDGSPFFRGPQAERFDAGYLASTQFPILLPSPTPIEEETVTEEEIEETTTAKPAMGRMGFVGGVFNKVKSGVGNTFGGIRKTIWGAPQTPPPTSPPTATPPPTNMYFPEENYFGGNPSHETNTIVFGEGDDVSVPNKHNKPPLPVEKLHCNGTQTEYNGDCYNVLQALPCPEGQWLIEDDETGKGKCVENKCADQGKTAFFGGKCVVVRTEEGCHTGMVTYIFKNGEVECDCKEQHLFNQRDGKCYQAYRKGPCRTGEVFAAKITKLGTLPASCVKSKCSKDGFFCNAPSCPKDRNCVELKSKCPNGEFDIHPETLTPKCIEYDKLPSRIIGNVPTLACAPGSRRDILGTCRKPTKITFS